MQQHPSPLKGILVLGTDQMRFPVPPMEPVIPDSQIAHGPRLSTRRAVLVLPAGESVIREADRANDYRSQRALKKLLEKEAPEVTAPMMPDVSQIRRL